MRTGVVAVWLLFLTLPVAGPARATSGSVELMELRTLDVGEAPIDVAATSDGAWTFVLTGKGNILIYTAEGKLKDRISVGASVDGIEVSPKGDRLILYGGKDRTLRFVRIDIIQKINIEGSPFKGPAGAPVEIAVFSDFQ